MDARLKWEDRLLYGKNFEGGGGSNNVFNVTCHDKATTGNSYSGQNVTESSDNDDGGLAARENEPLERLEVDSKLLDMIWMPDLYFVNDKEATVHDVTTPNRLLHIYRNGTIRTSSRSD